jgi:hypothetical protein
MKKLKGIINSLKDVWFVMLLISGLSMSAAVKTHGISENFILINGISLMVFIVLYFISTTKFKK